jgi:uncharacterized protein (DUF58 family)
VLIPASAAAGLAFGAEELVLLALAMAGGVLVGYIQCQARMRRAVGQWELEVQLESADVPSGSAAVLMVRAEAHGRAGAVPVRLGDPTEAWVRRGGVLPLEALRREVPGPAQSVGLLPLSDGGSVTLRFPIPTEERGIFGIGGVHLWCSDGLLLFSGLVASGPGATVTVLPVPEAVAVSATLLRGALVADESPRAHPQRQRQRQDLGDFAGLRTYVPGDRLRLVHWPSLARGGELMVRDFEDTGTRRVYLLADVRAHLGHRGVEAVVAAAAGVGLQALAEGTVVEFASTDGHRVAVGPGPHAALALLRELAAVDAAPSPGPRARRSTPVATPVVPRFPMPPVVLTTAGGANSLPVGLGSGTVVVVR